MQITHKADCTNAISCIVSLKYVDEVYLSCNGAINCDITVDQVTNLNIDFIGSTAQTLTCQDITSFSLSYTGLIYAYNIYGFTIPSFCQSELTQEVLDEDGTVITDATYSMNTDNTVNTAMTLTLQSVSVDSSQFQLFPMVSVRDITTIFSYSSQVSLVYGLPQYLSTYYDRLTNARAVLALKRTYTFKKIYYITPTRYTQIYQNFYDYQPEDLIANYYTSPRVQVLSPPPNIDISAAGNMQPIISNTYSFNYTLNNNTCSPAYSGSEFLKLYPTSANIYKQKYRERCEYLTGPSWNHVALYNKNNIFTMCVNSYCDSQVDMSGTNIQQEIRFFYNFKDQNSVPRARRADSSKLVQYLAFNEPAQYTLHLWIKAQIIVGSTDSFYVLDGSAIKVTFVTAATTATLKTLVLGQTIETASVIHSQSNQWLLYSLVGLKNSTHRCFTMHLSNYKDYGNYTVDCENPISNQWVFNATLYIGHSSGSKTASYLSIKNLFFVNYPFNRQEHMMTSHSEQLIKKIALFHYSLNNGKSSYISDSLAPQGSNIAITYSTQVNNVSGFIFERDQLVPKYCPEEGTQLYDFSSNTCGPKKVIYWNNQKSYSQKASIFSNISNGGVLPHAQTINLGAYTQTQSSDIRVNGDFYGQSYEVTGLGSKLISGWVLITFQRKYTASPSKLIGYIYAGNAASATVEKSASATSHTFSNLMILGQKVEYSTTYQLMGRLAHFRVYRYAIEDVYAINFNKYFDLQYSLNQYRYWTFEIQNQKNRYYEIIDPYNIMKDSTVDYGNTETQQSTASLLNYQKYLDDYDLVYSAVTLNGNSINSYQLNTQYFDWTLEFMYQASADSEKSSFLSISNFIDVGLIKDNDKSSITKIYYKIQITYHGLKLDSSTYFRYIKLWNVYIKPYPAQQLLFKLSNFQNLKSKLLIYYNINNNEYFYPHRFIFYDQRLHKADDTINTVDSSSSSTSPTQLLNSNICQANYTYSSSGCYQRVYLPLGLNYANQIKMPLPKAGGFTGLSGQSDFTISFWSLLKEKYPGGTLIQFDFNSVIQIREQVSGSDYQIKITTSSGLTQNLVTRSNLDLAITHYTDWHFFHFIYDQSTSKFKIYIDNIYYQEFSRSVDLTVSTGYSITLCPKQYDQSLPDCNTIIAYLKVYKSKSISFNNQCDYRLLLNDFQPNILSYWPLTYLLSDLSSDVLYDEGLYNGLFTSLKQQSRTSNSLWMTINEIHPEGGEDIAICSKGQQFSRILGKGEDSSALQQMRFKRSNQNVAVDVTSLTNQMNDWSLEFWFKFQSEDFYPYNYPDNIFIAGHDSCTSGVIFTLNLQLLTDKYEQIRYPIIQVTDLTNSLSKEFKNQNQELKDSFWYHFGITHDYLKSQIFTLLAFQQVSTDFSGGSTGFDKLASCNLQLGDKNGQSSTSYLDIMIFIRELRSWNVARTKGELLYYSNQPLFKGTPHLISYIKFTETDLQVFDLVKSLWSYDNTAQYSLSDTIVKIQTDGSDYFMNGCSPGQTIGTLNSIYGCNPYTSYLYGDKADSTAQIKMEMNSKLKKSIKQNDIQITIAISLKALQDSEKFTIFDLAGYFQLYKYYSAYYFSIQLSGGAKEVSLSGPYYSTSDGTKYNQMFIQIDTEQQLITLIEHKLTTMTQIIVGTKIQLKSYNQVKYSDYITVGDTTDSTLNKEAISNIVIFNKILTKNELDMIARVGIKSFSGLDQSILYQFLPNSNDNIYDRIEASSLFAIQSQAYPGWTKQSVHGFMTQAYDTRMTQICPVGYRLHFNYETTSNLYTYCVEKATLFLQGTNPLTLSTTSLKENIRYAMTISERFKVYDLNSNDGAKIQLFLWQSALELNLNTTHLELQLYNVTDKKQSKQNFTTVQTTAGVDNKWHHIVLTLFKMKWYLYLDYALVLTLNDTYYQYNVTNQDADTFNIELLQTQSITRLAIQDIMIFGMPISGIELLPKQYSGLFNTKLYNGVMINYYNFDETFLNFFSDKSYYSKQTNILASQIGINKDDQLFWGYEYENNKYYRSQDISLVTSSEGYDVVYAKDRTIVLNNKPLTLSTTTKFDSEFSIELCFYITKDQVALAELIGIYQGASSFTTIYFNSDGKNLTFNPNQNVNATNNTYNILIGYQNQWECITAASSYFLGNAFFANFLRIPDDQQNYYMQFQESIQTKFPTTPLPNIARSVIIGSKNFIGSIREVRIWSMYQHPGLMRRFYRSLPLFFHNENLTLYYPMNEGMGDTLYDLVKLQSAKISLSLTPWVKYQVYNEFFEVCEAERIYSENGYCFHQDKFLQLGFDSKIKFTITNSTKDKYALMTHATIFMWLNIRHINTNTQASLDLFKLTIQDRFTVTLDQNRLLTLNTNLEKSIMSNLNPTGIINQWGFLQIGCSQFVGSCEIHWGSLKNNPTSISLDSGTKNEAVYTNELNFWKNISSCQIQFVPTTETTIYSIYIKEFQIYNVLLPYQSYRLKLSLAVKTKQAPALIMHLKMDEMSGKRLYNHVFNQSVSFTYIYVEDASWVYFKQTVDEDNDQNTNRINYFYCNKENYTMFGDHCEYFQCSSQCYKDQFIGHCNGWNETDCAYLNTNGNGIVYDPVYNDYLACYRYCKSCDVPYLNTRCPTCIDSTFQYVDYQKGKNLYAVSNFSCWDYCPTSTYPNRDTYKCIDCPEYCVCDENSPTKCLSCMNSTFIWDKQRNICLLECPLKTLYNKLTQTCQDCSYFCQTCKGFTEYDCTSCIDGRSMFTLASNNKTVCVDRSCNDGYYFSDSLASCEACSKACETCNGPDTEGKKQSYNFKIDCITCGNEYEKFNGLCQDCITISQQDEKFAATFNKKKERCSEVCGDGFNMGIDSCDDGNIFPGDGCGSDCQIEKDFVCEFGSFTSADPSNTVIGSGYIDVRFAELVSFNQSYQNSFKDKIVVKVKGPDEPYTYTIQLEIMNEKDPQFQFIRIKFNADFDNLNNKIVSFDLSLNFNKQYFDINILVGDMFLTKNKVGVQSGNKQVFAPLIKRANNAAKSIGTVMAGFQNVMIIFLITNLALSVILQFLMNLFFRAQVCFQLLAFATADFFSFIPQYLDLFINLDNLDDYQPNERYSNLNFEGVYLVTNYYQKFQVFIIMFTLYPIFWLGSRIKHNIISKPFKYCYETMSYNFPIQFFTEMYLELAVTIWINIYNGLYLNNIDQRIANGIAIVVFMIVTFYPVWVYSVIMNRFNVLGSHTFHSKFGALVESIQYKLNSTLNQMWAPLFLFRRYTYSAILIVLQTWALICVVSIDVVTNLCFVVIDLYKKFKKLFKSLILKFKIYRRKKQGMPFDDLTSQFKGKQKDESEHNNLIKNKNKQMDFSMIHQATLNNLMNDNSSQLNESIGRYKSPFSTKKEPILVQLDNPKKKKLYNQPPKNFVSANKMPEENFKTIQGERQNSEISMNDIPRNQSRKGSDLADEGLKRSLSKQSNQEIIQEIMRLDQMELGTAEFRVIQPEDFLHHLPNNAENKLIEKPAKKQKIQVNEFDISSFSASPNFDRNQNQINVYTLGLKQEQQEEPIKQRNKKNSKKQKKLKKNLPKIEIGSFDQNQDTSEIPNNTQIEDQDEEDQIALDRFLQQDYRLDVKSMMEGEETKFNDTVSHSLNQTGQGLLNDLSRYNSLSNSPLKHTQQDRQSPSFVNEQFFVDSRVPESVNVNAQLKQSQDMNIQQDEAPVSEQSLQKPTNILLKRRMHQTIQNREKQLDAVSRDQQEQAESKSKTFMKSKPKKKKKKHHKRENHDNEGEDEDDDQDPFKAFEPKFKGFGRQE
ncbi:UNKNOWN [Stylonychia lemnae]|uniref:Uncharacterized protein n=1 Tax=Stylonychia lemnae TaxID=5949 RepID=A0A078ALY7_STYLE|nr:UNKNOWN [Stylonychia lemnae]|eukprot:CDW82422.1 UNKNOWN [Stylonychia lemnae]